MGWASPGDWDSAWEGVSFLAWPLAGTMGWWPGCCSQLWALLRRGLLWKQVEYVWMWEQWNEEWTVSKEFGV